MSFNIAIDGLAGAVKSSVAKNAARELGFIYVDTGAMYRTIALYLLREGIDPQDERMLAKALGEIDVRISYEGGVQHMLLNGEDVSDLIRTPEISDAASRTSAIPAGRKRLLDLQRTLASQEDVLMDGRDIGTMILPDADLKIFLTASVAERARRRYLEMKNKGQECILEEIRKAHTVYAIDANAAAIRLGNARCFNTIVLGMAVPFSLGLLWPARMVLATAVIACCACAWSRAARISLRWVAK